MTDRFQSSNAVLAAIRERLASAHTAKPTEILDAIVTALAEGRRYKWAGIYLAVENRGVWQAQSGRSDVAQNVALTLDQINAEIAAPIRLGARTLGLVVVEAGRASRPARQERVLVQQTAKLVARYLTSDRAKQLLRKTRERAHETSAAEPHKLPQSARPAMRRAAAGERGVR